LTSRNLEDLKVGDTAETTHVVTDADIRAFAEVSGDHNPVHLDEAYARRTVFRGRVAHGMLLGAHISAVLGENLPGPGAIYLSQTLQFDLPVKIGVEVLVRVQVLSIDEHRKATLSTICTVEGHVVATGQAVVIPPRRRKTRAE
jgi:3-hydroxybutyryl-CoA dehydratase